MAAMSGLVQELALTQELVGVERSAWTLAWVSFVQPSLQQVMHLASLCVQR